MNNKALIIITAIVVTIVTGGIISLAQGLPINPPPPIINPPPPPYEAPDNIHPFRIGAYNNIPIERFNDGLNTCYLFRATISCIK